MTESDRQTENLAHLEGHWPVANVKGYLDTPPDVDPHDREAVAEWLIGLSEALSLTDGILIVQQNDSEIPGDPPPTTAGVYVDLVYLPGIRLCPGKMPGVPWDRASAVDGELLKEWETYKKLYPAQVSG